MNPTVILHIIQLYAIGTFIMFMILIFPKRVSSKETLNDSFFAHPEMIFEFILFACIYLYLFGTFFFTPPRSSLTTPFMLGAIIAFIGLTIAFVGRYQLGKSWSPVTQTSNPKSIAASGIYAYLRHPIYLGRIAFFIGVMSMLNLKGLIIAIGYWLFLRKKAIQEEKYLLKKNSNYKAYKKRVPSWF